MPFEDSRSQQSPIDSGVQPATGQPLGENQEARPEQDVSRRQASRTEVALGDGLQDELEIGPDHTLTLKNGATIDVRVGRAAWNTLNSLLHTHPDLFNAVLAKVRGEEVSSAMQRELRRACLTLRSGELMQDICDVISSGYQETKDGPVIVNPFRLESEADRQAFEDCESRSDRNTLRLGGRSDLLAGPGDLPSSSPSSR